MLALALSTLLTLPLHADIYDRLDELPRHLRSGGVPRDGRSGGGAGSRG